MGDIISNALHFCTKGEHEYLLLLEVTIFPLRHLCLFDLLWGVDEWCSSEKISSRRIIDEVDRSCENLTFSGSGISVLKSVWDGSRIIIHKKISHIVLEKLWIVRISEFSSCEGVHGTEATHIVEDHISLHRNIIHKPFEDVVAFGAADAYWIHTWGGNLLLYISSLANRRAALL